MNTTSFTRRITATLSGPLVAVGIMLGAMVINDTATASADPAPDGQCTIMAMTGGRGGSAPNSLTRAGQVGAVAGPSASDGSMAVNCQPASHG